MSIADKINSINNIKNQIKESIKKKGVFVADNTPFQDYPDKIRAISTEADTTPPLITQFLMEVQEDNSLKINITTEQNARVVLTSPINKIILLTIDDQTNSKFSVIVPYPFIEGLYTLDVYDVANNKTTLTKDAKYLTKHDPIIDIFKTNDRGVYYDFNDIYTLYQDPSGTILANKLGNTVGHFKDKSGKGWDCSQLSASRQPKIGYNELYKSYFLQFDSLDDIITQQFSPAIDNYEYLTIIMTSDCAPTTGSGYRIGINLKGNDNFTNGFGILADKNEYIKAGVNFIDVSIYWRKNLTLAPPRSVPNTFIFTIKKSNNDIQSLNIVTNETTISDNTLYTESNGIPPLNTFQLLNYNSNIYKILIINRQLTNEETTLVRTSFNKSIGL